MNEQNEITQERKEQELNAQQEQQTQHPPEQEEQGDLPDNVKETIRKIREESKQRIAKERAIRQELEQKLAQLSREVETLRAIQEGRSKTEVERQQLEADLSELRKQREAIEREFRVFKFMASAKETLLQSGYTIEDESEVERFVSRLQFTGDDEEDMQAVLYAVRAFAKPSPKTSGVGKPITAQNINTPSSQQQPQQDSVTAKIKAMKDDQLYLAYGQAAAIGDEKLAALLKEEIDSRQAQRLKR